MNSFAWGDNDHGQQGSGNTIVNKKPSLVLGLEGIHINRVACGSSHSIAWTLPQNLSEIDKKEPVPFTVSKDPLGSHSLGMYSDSETTTSSPPAVLPSKPKRPSLAESLLSLENLGARQAALSYVLNGMSILQARNCVIAALSSHTQVQNKGIEKTVSIDGERVSLSPIMDENIFLSKQKFTKDADYQQKIKNDSGEAPADTSTLSINELADNDMPQAVTSTGVLSAYRSLTGSLSLSNSISSCNATQKHSNMSASAMSIIAATMTNQEEVKR